MVIMGLDHVDQFRDIVRHHEAGTIPPTVMWGACPTVFDPSQAPPGRHTGFMWEKLPYRLNGNAANWIAAREAHGRTMLALWHKHAPNLADAVIDSLPVRRWTPNDRFPICARAISWSAPSPMARSAITARSPAPALSLASARLYLCGSSSHPGGNITGLARVQCGTSDPVRSRHQRGMGPQAHNGALCSALGQTQSQRRRAREAR